MKNETFLHSLNKVLIIVVLLKNTVKYWSNFSFLNLVKLDSAVHSYMEKEKKNKKNGKQKWSLGGFFL